jgi:glutaminyl-tRNA synthetase
MQEDVRWLGFDWGDHLYYASDYFEQLYEYALQLIKMGKAYVDSLTAEEIRHNALPHPQSPPPPDWLSVVHLSHV